MVLDSNTMQGALTKAAGVPPHSKIDSASAAVEGRVFNESMMENQLAAMQGRDSGFGRGA